MRDDAVAALRSALPDAVCDDAAVRERHARDRWMLSELHDLRGRPPAPPRAVVTPRSAEEVAETLRLCRRLRVPVVPWGGGSGVCGAIATTPEAVVLSTEALTGLVDFDDANLRARFRAGTNGLEAEETVAARGCTIGHWPQSIALSTVGGWVATRAAGQLSTGYGSIEDLVLDLEAVLPDGTRLRTATTPRAAAGPDLRHLLLGSEGTLGVVTEVSLSLRPQPEARRGQAFHFPGLAEGLEPIRRALRAGWRPPVARLYDASESRRHFGEASPDGRAMAIWLHEGPEALVAAEASAVAALCREAGGVESDPALVDHWLAHRNRVPGFRPFLEKRIVVDTIEVGCAWDRAAELYRRVTGSLAEVPSLRAATAHASHHYRSGTSLYFTFAVRPDDPERMEPLYRECWRRVMEATLALGGGIAHHHGIGRVRRPWLARELGEGGLELLRSVKRALDPDGLLNPGVLLPDAEA